MIQRVLIDRPPFPEPDQSVTLPWKPQPAWSARWIRPPTEWDVPLVMIFALELDLNEILATRIHVSADERYELWLDGQRCGRGSEWGDERNWTYDSYDMTLPPGRHSLRARVWAFGPCKPWAQVSLWPGFLCAAEGAAAALIDTGMARWRVLRLAGYHLVQAGAESGITVGSGAAEDVNAAAQPWDWETTGGDEWAVPQASEPGNNGFVWRTNPTHLLRPAMLPPQRELPWTAWRAVAADAGIAGEVWAGIGGPLENWQGLLAGGEIRIPACSRRRVLLDIGGYVCGFPSLSVDGGCGATVALGMIETLLGPEDMSGDMSKKNGDRRRITGQRCRVGFDRLRPDGGAGRKLAPLWWRAGCWLELAVETADEMLVLRNLELRQTGYDFTLDGSAEPGESWVAEVMKRCIATWRACAAETFLDCPFYEQRMFPGDARIQALIAYVMSTDDRLARKALLLFDSSRCNPTGLTTECHPCTGAGIIAPFALWWIGMIHDFAWWRGDRAFLGRLLPGARAVIDIFLGMVGDDGLMASPPGWNFVDWVPEFHHGKPPGAESGQRNATLNWHLALALGQLADVEDYAGEPELAVRLRRRRDALVMAIHSAFWDEGRGLYSEDGKRRTFSEHAQILALLAGCPGAEYSSVAAGLIGDPGLIRAGLYFSHYLFEAYRIVGRADLLITRLEEWRRCIEIGLHTTPENFGDCRSDCHAWSAHPLFHHGATILGIRPDAMGFARVRIAPELGPLPAAAGRMAHSCGPITVALRRHCDGLEGEVVLPTGLEGVFIWRRHEVALRPGRQDIRLDGGS